MNKALLDTDILSEVGKGLDPNVVRNAAAYRSAHGFLTLSVISLMEVIQGYQRVGGLARIHAFRTALPRKRSSTSISAPPSWRAGSPGIWIASASPSAAAIR